MKTVTVRMEIELRVPADTFDEPYKTRRDILQELGRLVRDSQGRLSDVLIHKFEILKEGEKK